MIEPIEKQKCCGCHACFSVCSRQAIQMREDEEGFLYPHVDSDLCVNCGRCLQSCPALNSRTLTSSNPIICYAAKNSDDQIRLQSSSGGVFSIFASHIILQGGVVFGARWDDDFGVIHDYTETVEALSAFRGSKYLQSIIGESYLKVRKFLKDNRLVLFSGTPCQINGLKHFLGREYENLLTIDIACHGVPSPKAWKSYLQYIGRGKKLLAVNMREKTPGWKSYSIQYQFEGLRKIRNLRVNDPYMCCYLAGYITRPSCLQCPVKPGKNLSDITLADFWGISQLGYSDDDRGTSLVVVNSDQGQCFIDAMVSDKKMINYRDVVKYNASLIKDPVVSAERTQFWNCCHSSSIGKTVYEMGRQLRPSWDIRMKMYILNLLHK